MKFGPDLVALNAFISVGEIGGFRAAAEALTMTPSGVSKAIARLEKRIGAQLIARTTRSVRLTEVGAAFHTRCKGILEELSQAERIAAKNGKESQETLCISVPVAFGRLGILPLIAEYRRLYPGVAIVTRFEDRYVDLVDEGVDIAVRVGEPENSGLLATRASVAKFVCCGSPEYLASMGTPTHPSDLLRHHCVDYRASGADERFEWRFIVDGVILQMTPKSDLVVDNSDALVVAAEASAGLILIHSYLAEEPIRKRRLMPVLKDYTVPPAPIWIVRAPTSRPSVAVRAMFDFLKLRLHTG